MHALSSAARETFALRWRPRADTAVALLTALLMVGLYYANTLATQSPVFSLVVFVILTNGVLNVLFPAYYMLVVRREGLKQLGITRRWWWLALLLSVLISVLFWPQPQQVAAQQQDIDLLPLLLANGLILWEPFFMYGWLQLRFEQAFGVIPGIALAAVCFGAYHLGTFPPSGVGSLVLLGVFFGVLFRVAGGNLLALCARANRSSTPGIRCLGTCNSEAQAQTPSKWSRNCTSSNGMCSTGRPMRWEASFVMVSEASKAVTSYSLLRNARASRPDPHPASRI